MKLCDDTGRKNSTIGFVCWHSKRLYTHGMSFIVQEINVRSKAIQLTSTSQTSAASSRMEPAKVQSLSAASLLPLTPAAGLERVPISASDCRRMLYPSGECVRHITQRFLRTSKLHAMHTVVRHKCSAEIAGKTV